MKKLAAWGGLMLLVGLAVVAGNRPSSALSPDDHEAIVKVALDYIDGYYEGSAERMKRALHPDLAKRVIRVDRESGKQVVSHMTAEQLVMITASGSGKKVAETEGRQSDVTVLDVFHEMATVKVVAITWIDYLHVAKVDGEWKIINVLWGWKPETE
jgi:hypothetical protein